jgi:hypothetical protein
MICAPSQQKASREIGLSDFCCCSRHCKRPGLYDIYVYSTVEGKKPEFEVKPFISGALDAWLAGSRSLMKNEIDPGGSNPGCRTLIANLMLIWSIG